MAIYLEQASTTLGILWLQRSINTMDKLVATVRTSNTISLGVPVEVESETTSGRETSMQVPILRSGRDSLWLQTLGPTSSGDLLTITSGFTWLQLTGRLNFVRIPFLRAPSIRGCLATTGGINQARRPQRSCKVAKAITSKPTNQINGGGVGFINMEVEVSNSTPKTSFKPAKWPTSL